jgi:cytosine/adenosine deaminase-related metal-dependent hydrolase
MEQAVYSGLVLAGPTLEPRFADVVVEAGRIGAVEERKRAPERWICPAFFNAHTHLGDTIAMDAPARGELASLVAPPDGLKHRLLREARRDDCVAAIRQSVRRMMRGGTAGFADFREGGTRGIEIVREALRGLPIRAIVLGRAGGESVGDGAGIASTRDIADYRLVVERVRSSGGLIGFHAGECTSDDVDPALDCRPDFVVHMTHATDAQLMRCAEEGIPIVCCPRSNWRLGVADRPDLPPVASMLECGCTVLLGTDNAMFVSPDMGGELMFASTIYRCDPVHLLRAAIEGSAVLAEPSWIQVGARASFVVVNPERAGLSFSRDPIASLVRRFDASAIEKILLTCETNL